MNEIDVCECSELQCEKKQKDNYCDGSCGCWFCRDAHTDAIETAEMSALDNEK